MTHAQLRQAFYQALTSNYLQGELLSLYHWCVEEIEGWNKTQAYLKNDVTVSEESHERWSEVIKRLQSNEPVQYIFNKAYFGDLQLYVDSNVLIPRPETEELVMLMLENENNEMLRILDIGTGSGCIPLMIKHARKGWKVSACDISEGALEVAKRNSETLGLDVILFKNDVLSDTAPLPAADVYISNPPYIPETAKIEMESNVLEHEPHIALFAPHEDPLAFYKRIALSALKNKVKSVYFETHATDMGIFKDELSKIWSGEVVVQKDMAGKDRFVILR